MTDSRKNKEDIASAVEAILFVSGETLDFSSLARLLETDEEQLNDALEMLETKYVSTQSGIKLLRAPEGVQLVTHEKHSEMVDNFLKQGVREQLSPAAAETLAIVAYRGPIHRAGVEAIRGVNSSFSLRILTIRGLVDRFPSEKDSRVFLYRINAEFLRHLGLNKVEDLPDYENFRQHEVMTRLEKSAETGETGENKTEDKK